MTEALQQDAQADEQMARALYFDHVDQHGYPNGLPTWDELPDVWTRACGHGKDYWVSLGRAALATTPALKAENQRLLAWLSETRRVLEETPELNMSNYTEDDVSALNQGFITAYQIVRAALTEQRSA